MTPEKMVLEFHEAFGLDIDSPDSSELRRLRARLVVEEAYEMAEALIGTTGASGLFFDTISNVKEHHEPKPLKHVAKESADLKYVSYGTDVALGIDADRAVELVHESNMSKLGEDGKPIFREDGKVLKSNNYFEPDMTGVIRDGS